MQNYRVGYNEKGRCQVKYVNAHTKAAAIFQVLEEHPDATHHVVREMSDNIKSDKQWADQR